MNTISPAQALAAIQAGETPWVALDKLTGLPVGFFSGRQAARDFARDHNAKVDKAVPEIVQKANGAEEVAPMPGPVEVAVIERRQEASPPIAPTVVEGVPFYAQWKANGVCPHCGDDPSSITAAGREGTTLGDNFDFCHHCGVTFNNVTGKIHKGNMDGHVKTADAPVTAIPHVNKSTVERPTKLVWHIADEMKGAKRKEVLAACVARGIAFYTARTQYQQWLMTQKEQAEREAATAAKEKAAKK